MKYTNYSLGESRYCYGLFRRCKRRRGHVDKQPEVKKEVKKTPVQKPEKKIDVDSIWKRSKEVQGSMNRAKDKFDKLKEKGGEKFKGKFDNAWGEYSGGVDNLKDRYSKIREEIDKLRAGKEGTEEAKKELLHLLGEYDKVIDKLNKASSDLEKPVQDELDRLEKIEKDRLEKIEKDRIEALRNSDVEKPQEVIVDSGQSEEEPETIPVNLSSSEVEEDLNTSIEDYKQALRSQVKDAKQALVAALESERDSLDMSTDSPYKDRDNYLRKELVSEMLEDVQKNLENDLDGVELRGEEYRGMVEGIQGLVARVQTLEQANPEDVVKDLKEKLAKVKATRRPGGTQGRAKTKRLNAQEKNLTTMLQKPEEHLANLTKQIADKQAEVDKAIFKGGLQKELTALYAELDQTHLVQAYLPGEEVPQVARPREMFVSHEEPEAVAEATAEIGKEAFKEYVSELGHQLDSAKKELVSAIEDDLEARQTRQKSTGGVHLDRMASQSLREAQEALKTVQGGLDNNLAGVDLPQGAWQQSVEGIQGLSARIQVLGRANPEDVVKDLKEKLAKVKATPRPGGTQGRAATKRLDAQEKYLTTILQKPEEYRENLTKQIADKQAEVDKAWIKGGLQKELADLHAESDKAYIVEALNHVLQNSDDSLLANN